MYFVRFFFRIEGSRQRATGLKDFCFPKTNTMSSTTPTPVSADDIARRSYEQRYLIEDRVTASLVEVINEGIREQVSHGLLEYEFSVPHFIMGFPRFDVAYVGDRLRCMYREKGFVVTGKGASALLHWPKKPAKPVKKPPSSQNSTTSKKVLLLRG